MEIKTEKQEPDGEKSEVEQRVLPAGQAGSGPELQKGAALHPIKQEAEHELQQCWETQWQRFLRTMQAPCPGWRAPQLPLLSSGKAPRASQTDCKAAAENSLHPRREPATQAWPSPAGEPCESHLDFSVQVKEEVPDEEELVSLEARCQRFRRFCYREAEGPREACRQLQELCRQWLEPERHSKEQILERVTLEQFLAVLPPEMQSWVRESGPETCVQAVALAEDFLLRLERREQQFQKLQLVEEVIVHSPKAERDLLDSEDMQLSFDAEQDSDGEAESEKEKANLQPERPKKTEVRALSLDTARGAFPQVAEAGERPSSQPGLKPSQEISLGQTQGQHREDGDRRSAKNRSQQPTPRQATEKKAVECGKSYPLGLGLVQPAKAQSYECSYCGKRWPCQSQLRRHVKIHTGERPHKCTDCGKSFSTSSNLSQHKRVHTGERPYSCKDCGKSYRRRASLVQHERETCRKGSRFSAPTVGYVVLGNCTLLCMKKSTQGARNRVIAPKGGDPSLADQPLNILTGYSQERSCAKD
ncbi:Zinc finger protein 24 [Varanus komodoensis]|nr:Zinc finger protein 24 [Varanus komodoensis]